MDENKDIACPGCGLVATPFEGSVHLYMTSSPHCWNLYGQILAREYQDSAYMAHHRLTVDAYALQHPGSENPQATQSVNIHLLALHLIFSKNMPISDVLKFMQSFSAKHKGQKILKWLAPPDMKGLITVEDVLKAESAEAHGLKVREWAESVYHRWNTHHKVAERNFYEMVGG